MYSIKALCMDGTVLEHSLDTAEIWEFEMAVTEFGMQVHHWKANRYYDLCVQESLGRNVQPGEIQVAFRPTTEMSGAVFFDDVASSNPGHILIETSPNNFQAHYLLSRNATESEVAAIRKHLILDGVGFDRVQGAMTLMAPVQARRFPEGRFVHDVWKEPLDVDLILGECEPTRG